MKSLDYVQQPDGSFLWEMVELDDIARAREAEQAAKTAGTPTEKPRTKRRSATEETVSESASYEF